MSTLDFIERHISPFDILFRNLYNAESQFAPALNFKQPHPVNIVHDDDGLHFEVACTGLTKKEVDINIEDIISTILFLKTNEKCKFKQLIDITAVDFPHKEKRYKIVYSNKHWE